MSDFRLPDSTHMGPVHLRVPDVLPALQFYRDILGLREVEREDQWAVLSATGDYPAAVVLTGQRGARRKPTHTTGLYHVAIRLPNRRGLARVLKRLAEHGWPLQGAADHGVSEALYLPDHDGNGIELYCDRPRDQWPWEGEHIAMVSEPLNVPSLLAEARDNAPWDGIDPGTDIGHVHLQVSNLGRAEAFYCDLLGMDVMQRNYPGALFVSAGGYHHHLGLNIWAGQGAPPPPPDAIGLIWFSVMIPGDGAYRALLERIEATGIPAEDQAGGVLVRDPDGMGVLLVQE